jgi:hypothetical protein
MVINVDTPNIVNAMLEEGQAILPSIDVKPYSKN